MISDEELLVIISEGIACLPSCGATSCDCLNIMSDVNVRECVAQYFLQFVRKSKYDQDSIILEWYKYANAARIAAMIGCRQQLWFCLPYDATLNTDIDCLRASLKHRLCLLVMRSLLGIGGSRYRSIRAAASVGATPRHKYIKPFNDVLKMVKEEKVIRIENRAKVKAVKEDKTVGIMTDDDAFGWKKKKVPEIKEGLKRLGLGAHSKKAELVARLEEHLSTEPSQAKPSNAEPNNG
jgi:hypothetical protein